MLQDQRRPTALISYSHESAEHEARVLALANRLRGDGIDCDLDQYVPGGTPPEGWPLWMQTRIEHSDFTLMICTATYTRRVLHQEPPDVGRGVIWEANLLYNLLYHDDSFKCRAVPVLLEGGTVRDIPLPFRDSYCDLGSPTGYADLLQRLFGVPRAFKPALGPASIRDAAAIERVRRTAAQPVPQAPVPNLIEPNFSAPNFDQALLDRLQKLLIDVLGPIGPHMVAQASQTAPNFSALIDALAAQFPDKKSAELFRSKAIKEVESADSESSTARPTWDPIVLDQARRMLAVSIGPLATLMVERIARAARTKEELFAALAAEVPSGKDRAKFLAELGSHSERSNRAV